MQTEFTKISVEALVNAPLEKVWNCWSDPLHITKWCFASDDWHAPKAENELEVGKTFKTTMAAKDGSFSFDFGGKYTTVEYGKRISYVLEDGRQVDITFEQLGDSVKVTEDFDAESEHSIEMQKGGWQAILDNFKKYTESV
jgi:uncharacterized protein YndB with AHSA1/START domain